MRASRAINIIQTALDLLRFFQFRLKKPWHLEMQDQKKFQDQQHVEQETIFGSKPSPARTASTKKVVGPRANGNANGTPNRRLSMNSSQNGRSAAKDGRRDSTSRPAAPVNYVAISKEDAASHVSGTEAAPASP